MQTTTIIYVVGALLFSVAFSWLLYFYKSKAFHKIDYLLFSLRTTSIFLLLLLLINPTIERLVLTNEKPILSVLVDNSVSIQYFKKENNTKELLKEIQSSNALKDKFDLQFFTFGASLNVLDSVSFLENQTNIYQSLSGVEALHKNTTAPIILLSDGNQTNGSLFPYVETNKNIFPVVIGDTIAKNDIRIAQVNVNKYSYLKNKFPVEIRVLYEGISEAKTQLTIHHKGKVVFKENITFTENKNVQTITTTITSNEEGIQYYAAEVSKIDSEENSVNNSKVFSVEVLNEQTKILLLTSVLHPDIGAFKKSIETNKQRAVVLKNIVDFTEDLNEYQLVILYQPTANFQPIFDKINKENLHYLVVSGVQTNWNFLNEMQSNYYKNPTNQSEEYGAIFNNGFLTFGQKNISFESFSPLKDVFGQVDLKSKFDALLYQNISGIETETPLLSTFENDFQKSAILFGEGIWKWRANSFMNTGSFQDFDGFMSNLIQYLASNKKRERLTIGYEKLYLANVPIVVSAFYVDKNYQFDPRAKINLKLTNTDTNVIQNIPFSLQNNSFEAVLENLPSGNYRFIVDVENQNVEKSGEFKIAEYQIEEQFTRANLKELKLLALNTKGKIYFESTSNQLIKDLVSDKRYVITQKSSIINQQLINWKFILILSIAFFATEWFIRKYFGKI